jgi:hypothetical protein
MYHSQEVARRFIVAGHAGKYSDRSLRFISQPTLESRRADHIRRVAACDHEAELVGTA